MSGTRRQFLHGLGAMAAAAGLPAPARAIEPVKRTGSAPMRLSLAAYSFRRSLVDRRRPTASPPADPMTLDGFIDLCAGYGISGTELTAYYLPDPIPPGYLPRLRKRAFLHGLTVSGTAIGNTFTLPPGPARDREIAEVKAWIDRAAEMGAPVIRIFAGDLQPGTGEADARQWTIEAIEECCQHAGERGVLLALENHGGIVSTIEQMLAIVRAVKSEWFGVNWDSGNFKSRDPYADLAALAPYAVTAQIKIQVGSPTGPVPADLPRVITILRAAGYRGWVTLEYEGDEDPKIAVPKYLDQLRPLVER